MQRLETRPLPTSDIEQGPIVDINQSALPGIEWSNHAPSPDDLAILPVGMKDMATFIQIEDSLERSAAELERDCDKQAAADGYVITAEAYEAQGFYIKAALLKGKAAELYLEANNLEIAGLELNDAIGLDRMAHKLASLTEEVQDHNPDFPIRANYPNLFTDFTYRRGEANRHHLSSNSIIYAMLHDHYTLLFAVVTRVNPSYKLNGLYNLAIADLNESNSDLTAERRYCKLLFTKYMDTMHY